MGREIRRVPPNWEHPQEEKFDVRRGTTVDAYKPMHDWAGQQAWRDWLREYDAFQGVEHDRIIAEYGEADYPKDQPYVAFCGWHGSPPDPEYCRPAWSEDEATWWQVYETVSEGTPVTPPFETQEELIEYLVVNGDFWDQSRRAEGNSAMNCEPWPRKQAEAFVLGPGWAPSLVRTDSRGFRSGVEALADLANQGRRPRQ